MKELQQTLADLMFKETGQERNQDNVNLYEALIQEEFNEWNEEVQGSAADYKELCDLMWVIIQYANQVGFDLDAGMQELITEYRSKFYTADGKYEPKFREDGKLLKNTGFKKADFAALLQPVQLELDLK